MKQDITNPFITGGYVDPTYFCNRTSETKKISDAIASRRNVTLISLRRMGKTGLLKHVKYLLENSKKKITVIYVDLLPTMDGIDMLNAITSALLRVRTNERNFMEKMVGFLASLRPRFTIDPLTGEPSVDLKVEPAGVQAGLEQILKLIPEIKQPIVFMFDEFQQIASYPAKNTEAMLRSVIQMYPTVPFVFSGSSKHMLENMFMSPGKPFYQSSELMYLDRISDNNYKEFIRKKFAEGKTDIDYESIERIFDWTRLHTWYVQYVCNHLYEKRVKSINIELTNNVFHQILNDFEPQFVNYRNLLPLHQFKLLKAIASENGIAQPTAGTFISKHDLTSPSSVSTSMKALSEKEMIVYDNNRWHVYDVFLARWFEYHFKD
jgi:AAA+ ATPase superfamily predicted ATPase